MSNALAIYERINEMQAVAGALHASGFFADVKSQAQALVKVMAGAEMGLPAFASMSGIHLVQGKPVLGANLIATLVKNDPRYDYRVKQADNQACILTWFENGQQVGESGFTMAEAQTAGLTGKDSWKKYPSDMLFARAISRGARRYAPGIFGGAPVYTPDEVNLDDEDGNIITVSVPPTPVAYIPAAVVEATEPSAGDLAIAEAPARDFVKIAAEMLKTDMETVKARLHALGYVNIPGDKGERVRMYRRLSSEMESEQSALFSGVAEAAEITNGAYEE